VNDAQRNLAGSYERLFNTHDSIAVLDDVTQFVNALPIEHQAGAMRLLTYVLLKRSAIRREKAQGVKAPAKGKLNGG
jgi:flagellar biosynthesis regulator FlaF